MTYIGSPEPAGGGGTDTIGLSGIAFGNIFVTNPATTTNTVMFTEIVPSGRLANNGEVIRFDMGGQFNNNANSDETAILTMNGSTICTATTALRTVSAGGILHMGGTIMRSGASYLQTIALSEVGDAGNNTSQTTTYIALPINSAGSLVLQMTGGATTSGTIIHHYHKIWWEQK